MRLVVSCNIKCTSSALVVGSSPEISLISSSMIMIAIPCRQGVKMVGVVTITIFSIIIIPSIPRLEEITSLQIYHRINESIIMSFIVIIKFRILIGMLFSEIVIVLICL